MKLHDDITQTRWQVASASHWMQSDEEGVALAYGIHLHVLIF